MYTNTAHLSTNIHRTCPRISAPDNRGKPVWFPTDAPQHTCSPGGCAAADPWAENSPTSLTDRRGARAPTSPLPALAASADRGGSCSAGDSVHQDIGKATRQCRIPYAASLLQFHIFTSHRFGLLDTSVQNGRRVSRGDRSTCVCTPFVPTQMMMQSEKQEEILHLGAGCEPSQATLINYGRKQPD